MQSSVRICHFNDCDNAAIENSVKCAFHRNRRQCIVETCTNQVYARQLCVRHGGKKQCQYENCEAHARGGGYCIQHGGYVVKRFCIVQGCKKQAHARQKCVRHGGGRQCRVEDCTQHARAGNLCNRHSDGHQCAVKDCMKTAQHMSTICFRHAMEFRARGEIIPNVFATRKPRSIPVKRPVIEKMKMDTNEKRAYIPSPIAYNASKANSYSSNVFELFPTDTLQSSPRMWSPMASSVPIETNLFAMSGSLGSYPSRPTLGQGGMYENKYGMPTNVQHAHEGEDLETILATYSRLFYTSPKHSVLREEKVGGPPSLVRMNSLLPPEPGMVTGNVPQSTNCSFRNLNVGKSDSDYATDLHSYEPYMRTSKIN